MLNNRLLVLCLLKPCVALNNYVRLRNFRVDTKHFVVKPLDLVFLHRFYQPLQDQLYEIVDHFFVRFDFAVDFVVAFQRFLFDFNEFRIDLFDL